MPVRSYDQSLNAETIRGVHADLTTSTPACACWRRFELPDLAAGRHGVEPDFVHSQDRTDLRARHSDRARVEVTEWRTRWDHALPHALHRYTAATSLLTENFDGGAGNAPAGWTSAHGGRANIVPWRTSNTFCGATSNTAFHQNAADGPGTTNPFTNTRWERLFSPQFSVPGDSDYVTIDMDICYDTEDDPNFNVLAYDGLFLRVADLTPGRLIRSVMVEAFEDEFTTGGFLHYPKHFPRNSNPAYFEDVSAWAGESHGVKHVHLRLPGMAGSRAQLRFEFAQDAIATCADVRPGHTCGVAVDNIVVRSVHSTAP